jgi:hypothetical protein
MTIAAIAPPIAPHTAGFTDAGTFTVNLLLSVWTVLVGGIVVEDYVKRASAATLSSTRELVEDHLGSGGPDEGFGRGIVILDEAVDGGLRAPEVVAALATVLWHFWGTCPNLDLRVHHISRPAEG